MFQYRALFSKRGSLEFRGEFIEAMSVQEALDSMDLIRGVNEGFKSLEFLGRAPDKAVETARAISGQSNEEWLAGYESK